MSCIFLFLIASFSCRNPVAEDGQSDGRSTEASTSKEKHAEKPYEEKGEPGPSEEKHEVFVIPACEGCPDRDSIYPFELEKMDYSKYPIGYPMEISSYHLELDPFAPFGLIGYDSLKALFPDYEETAIEVLKGWIDFVLFKGENYIRVANPSRRGFEVRAMDLPTDPHRFGKIYNGMPFQEFIEEVAPDSIEVIRGYWAGYYYLPLEYFPEDSAQTWWKRQKQYFLEMGSVTGDIGGMFTLRWPDGRLKLTYEGGNSNGFSLSRKELSELRPGYH